MDVQVVRQLVKQFWEKTAYTGGEAHCFTPWYLHHKFQLPETRAMQQSSDGGYDFGIDAFHLIEADDGKPATLVLVQAKYSDSLAYIIKGFKELEKVLPEVARGIQGIETAEFIQNKVLVNLRAALARLDAEVRQRLKLDFEVLHLSTEDEAILANRLREPMTRLQEALRDTFESSTCRIRQIGPRDLGPQQVVVAPPEEVMLRLAGLHEFGAGENSRMISGVAKLADLVELYSSRRDDLFSRNVRYYIHSKKNTEKGAAGKMRETLKQMCVDDAVSPERFAIFHNGITMYSRRTRLLPDGELWIRDPYILNGCQTIKNAFLFREEKNLKSKIKNDLWRRVCVPVRVIETTDDDLVRAVTVNNNRQNAMSPAALRSNDSVQIRLEQRFKERGIVYQRQQGRFDDIWATRPDLLDDEYANTQGTWVDIEDLARAIAATDGRVRLALHQHEIFESDLAYERCFDEKARLRSIVFLTFLQNLHDIVGLVLKMDLNLKPKGGPRPARFVYHTICMLTRYLAKERMSDFVAEWGTRLYYRDKDFREEIRKILNSNSSGIRGELARRFMTLESGDADDINSAFEQCKNALRLRDGIDPFDAFVNLDDEVSVDLEQ